MVAVIKIPRLHSKSCEVHSLSQLEVKVSVCSSWWILLQGVHTPIPRARTMGSLVLALVSSLPGPAGLVWLCQAEVSLNISPFCNHLEVQDMGQNPVIIPGEKQCLFHRREGRANCWVKQRKLQGNNTTF